MAKAVWRHRGDGLGFVRLREIEIAALARILERRRIRPDDVVYVGNDSVLAKAATARVGRA